MLWMTRREIENLLGEKISDEAWEENKKVFTEYNKQYHLDGDDSDLDE